MLFAIYLSIYLSPYHIYKVVLLVPCSVLTLTFPHRPTSLDFQLPTSAAALPEAFLWRQESASETHWSNWKQHAPPSLVVLNHDKNQWFSAPNSLPPWGAETRMNPMSTTVSQEFQWDWVHTGKLHGHAADQLPYFSLFCWHLQGSTHHFYSNSLHRICSREIQPAKTSSFIFISWVYMKMVYGV